MPSPQRATSTQRAAGLVPAVLAALSLVACILLAGCQEKSLPAATHSPNSTALAESSTAKAQSQPLRNVTFDTIKFNIKKEEPFRSEMLTPAIKKLDGSRVRIRGYILPPPQQSGLTRFVLVRDNMQCCFGPGAALYDSMIVTMRAGDFDRLQGATRRGRGDI